MDILKGTGFNPEGAGYDYKSATEAGIKADKHGHWPSRSPKTGMILKGRQHLTWYKMVEADKALGYKLIKGKDKRYYSIKKGK